MCGSLVSVPHALAAQRQWILSPSLTTAIAFFNPYLLYRFLKPGDWRDNSTNGNDTINAHIDCCVCTFRQLWLTLEFPPYCNHLQRVTCICKMSRSTVPSFPVHWPWALSHPLWQHMHTNHPKDWMPRVPKGWSCCSLLVMSSLTRYFGLCGFSHIFQRGETHVLWSCTGALTILLHWLHLAPCIEHGGFFYFPGKVWVDCWTWEKFSLW